MLDYADARWTRLHGGYRRVYDPRPALRLLQAQKERIDLGWNAYALAATIEVERRRAINPAVPAWLASLYGAAWISLRESALHELREATDSLLVRSALAVVALSRDLRTFGAVLATFEDGEVAEFLDDQLGWSELYEDKGSAH